MKSQESIERRRVREKRTISCMISLNCAAHCPTDQRTQTSHCGEAVCAACAELDAYAVTRTERCRNMAVKTSCEECGCHCYHPVQRERIRTIMRYAGPRMMRHHPIAAVRHLLGK